jgi:cell division septation protein DedD
VKKTIIIIVCLMSAIFSLSFAVSYTLKKVGVSKPSTESAQTKIARERSDQELAAASYDSVGGAPKQAPNLPNKLAARFTIELSSLNTQAQAEALLLKLRSRGIEGFYTPVRRGGQVIYKVRLGMFTSPQEAKKVLAKVNASAAVNGVVSKLQ